MEKEIREVVYTKNIDKDLSSIYQYGIETFGVVFANVFLAEFHHTLQGLSFMFNTYPECRHLNTISKMYRNAIVGKYLIKYRIKSDKIEVLRVLHGSVSVKTIKNVRSIKS